VRTRLLTITLAAVLALVGVVAILAYVRQANERAVNGLKAETVMVASSEIPAGTSLSEAKQEKLLVTERVPDSSLSPNSAVLSVTTLNKNLVVSATMAKGQVLLQNMLTQPGSVTPTNGFALPAGDIAVTVDFCVPEAVANYVTPGSDVAVFDTVVNSSDVTPSCSSGHSVLPPNAAINTVVLPSIEVLAVGQNSGTQSTSGGSNVAAATDPASSPSSSSDVLVTFAATPHDAQELILLQEIGIPYLALLGSNSPPLVAGQQATLPAPQP
jgi:pilus assembly protein CpaB